MNAKAERIAFKDEHRFPSWPPCIRPFLKGLSWKIKSMIFFPSNRPTKQEQMWHEQPLLCAYLREKSMQTKAGDLAAGQREGQLEFRPLMTRFASAHSFVLCRKCRWEKGLCPLIGRTHEIFAKDCHFAQLHSLSFPHIRIPTRL